MPKKKSYFKLSAVPEHRQHTKDRKQTRHTNHKREKFNKFDDASSISCRSEALLTNYLGIENSYANFIMSAALAGGCCGATTAVLFNIAGIGVRAGPIGLQGKRGFVGLPGRTTVGPTGQGFQGFQGNFGPQGAVLVAADVPNVTGQTAGNGQIQIFAAGLVPVVVGGVGPHIFAQSPIGGSIVPVGSTVQLILGT